MSDLYGSSEAEDMSCFLQILLQNPSSSAAAAAGGGGGLFNSGGATAESSTTLNFSDPGCFFARESARTNPSFREPEAYDVASNPGSSRSLKRSRDAEVHNLSEKRRRSRINEKLKALLTLIPNSNKTDKASMLDEAIEYLKQLQLQVQTLTMRNGVSLHPGYSMGPLPSTLAQYSSRLDLDEGPSITNRVTGTLLRDPNVYMQNMIPQRTNHNTSTLPMLMLPSTRNTDNCSEILPSYAMLDHLASNKDICRDDTSSRLQLDFGRSGNTSSPGISS